MTMPAGRIRPCRLISLTETMFAARRQVTNPATTTTNHGEWRVAGGWPAAGVDMKVGFRPAGEGRHGVASARDAVNGGRPAMTDRQDPRPHVIPAKAGIHPAAGAVAEPWIPAFAGMTCGGMIPWRCGEKRR